VIVLDASVLIAQLDAADGHHVRARDLLFDIAPSRWVASTITVAEALVGPVRRDPLDEARSVVAQLGVEEVPLAAGASVRLAGLRVATGLKLPDCCVLLAAEQVDGAIATFDDRLAASARSRGFVVRDGPPTSAEPA
jgi:predicted nucleic acid-binding protein